jgi:hypothetical protein
MEFIVKNAIFEDVDNSTIISNPKAFSATIKEYSIEEDSEGNEFVVKILRIQPIDVDNFLC